MCTTNFILTFIICRRNKWIRLEVLRLFIVLVSEHINFSQFMMQSVTMGIFYFRQAFSRFVRCFISFSFSENEEENVKIRMFELHFEPLWNEFDYIRMVFRYSEWILKWVYQRRIFKKNLFDGFQFVVHFMKKNWSLTRIPISTSVSIKRIPFSTLLF